MLATVLAMHDATESGIGIVKGTGVENANARGRGRMLLRMVVAGVGGVGGGEKLKAGQSILQQIGAPDYNGWMRKKGEHYNVWKSRYFVLKGPHLYYLKSNSKTVRQDFLLRLLTVRLWYTDVFHRKRRSRVTSTSLATRSSQMRMPIPVDTVSVSSTTQTSRITSARKSRWSYANG